MAAYLRFYQFDSSPFDGSVAKRGMVLGTQSLRGALSQLKQGLEEGAPRLCFSGSEGVGKTSFCRALPKLLAQEAKVAIVADPRRSWDEMRAGVAKKFGTQGGAVSRRALMDTCPDGKRLVLVIDRAELLSHEVLDHLDVLLQYKDDDGNQLLHCILLANLEAAATGAETPLMWWLDKFTTMQLQFSPIPVEGVRHYVEKHLAKAGWAGGELFTRDAMRAIHANTGGIPAAINQLCERILIEGGIRGVTSIHGDFIEELCGNSEAVAKPSRPLMDTAELSADLSLGDFGTSPTAQQMLDDPRAQSGLEANDPKDESAPRIGDTEDIASLLMTQDSTENLHRASETRESQTDTSAIELEEDPHERRFADFYDSPRGTTAAVGMTRNRSKGPSQGRKPGGMIMALLLLAVAGWFAYSQLTVPSDLIKSAESKIEKVLEKTPKLTLKPKAQIAQDDEEEEAEEDEDSIGEIAEDDSALPPSLIDRADEMVADPSVELVPVLEGDPALETRKSESPAAVAETSDTDSDSHADGKVAKTPKETVAATPTTTKRAPAAKPSAPVKRQSTEIPSEMLVINEYTAIPEAASAAPKLALPVDDEAEGKTDDLAASPERKKAEARTPSAPARIAPDAATPPAN